MRKMKLSDLVFDYDLYPRTAVNDQTVRQMLVAYQAGAKFPPFVIDKRSKRVIDGFHRAQMYERADGEDAEVEVVEKTYKDDAAMYRDAIEYNAKHGRPLSTCDRVHCIVRAEELGIELEQIAATLQITVDVAGKLRVERVGEMVRTPGMGAKTPGPVALKQTIRHMAGQGLTVAQCEANTHLGGMNQAYYVYQLIILIEADLLDSDNEKLIEALRKLHGLLDGVLCAQS